MKLGKLVFVSYVAHTEEDKRKSSSAWVFYEHDERSLVMFFFSLLYSSNFRYLHANKKHRELQKRFPSRYTHTHKCESSITRVKNILHSIPLLCQICLCLQNGMNGMTMCISLLMGQLTVLLHFLQDFQLPGSENNTGSQCTKTKYLFIIKIR